MTRIIALLLVGLMFSCGASARDVQINAMVMGLNTTSDAFVSWDVAHQERLLDKATSIEEGTSAIAAYRVKQAQFLAVLRIAYNSLATAKILNDTHTLSTAIETFTLALKAWEDVQK